MMPTLKCTFDLEGREREDGSVYYTCADLPGFHFILGPEESIDEILAPALKDFAIRYLAGRMADSMPTFFRPTRQEKAGLERAAPRKLMAEFACA